MAFDAHDWLRRLSPGSGPTKGGDVAALYTDDAERWDVAIGARTVGREALTAYAQAFLDTMPDSVAEARAVIVAGDEVVIEWTWRGTHTGDMEGWPARGEPVEINGVQVLRLRDGLIAAETSYWDAKTLFGG